MGIEEQDEAFLTQAQRQRLLNAAQVSMLRSELRRRRSSEPGLRVHVLAMARGLMDADAAIDVWSQIGIEVPVTAPAEPSEAEQDAMDDAHFAAVPKMVEAIPDKQDVQKKSGDSVLEMDQPPPTERSGDSLFEEGEGSGKERSSQREPSDSSVEVAQSPSKYFERHMDELSGREGGNGSTGAMALSGDDSVDSGDSLASLSVDDLADEEEEVRPTAPPQFNAPEPSFDEAAPDAFAQQDDFGAQAGVMPDSWGDAHGATMPPTMVEASADLMPTQIEAPAEMLQQAEPEMMPTQVEMAEVLPTQMEPDPRAQATEYEVMPGEATAEVSNSQTDSAIMEAFKEADSNYFGDAADLTHPPDATHAPPPPSTPDSGGTQELPQVTLFDSSAVMPAPGAAAAALADAEQDDFSRTKPPRAPEPKKGSATVTEVVDDSEFDLSLAGLAGEEKEPSSKASTIYDDSEVSEEELTGNRGGKAKVTTGGKSTTGMATGEVARKGAAGGKKALGVESDITAEKVRTGEQIEASQMTLAQLRNQMGIGEGVKIDAGADKIVTTLERLKSGGSGQKRYTVVREIARGGMGKVLEVEDNDLRRSVALKVLRKEMLGRKDLVERFLEEAQITGQLEHPNIVPVHEIGVDGRGNLYFTMKLVEGEDLSSIIKRLRNKDEAAIKKWPLSRLLEVYIKVCEGLALAHARGVIHRDLKPANIMVGRFGEAQIMDWGVAKIVGRKDKAAVGERTVLSDRHEGGVATTMVGAILGTPTYMSPEQARGETDTLTPASDMFSMGVILYELLSLKLPWSGRTSEEVLDQVREVNPEPPSKKAPERKIPPELESLAMICLQKDAGKRIGNVTDLLDNLKSYQEGRTLAAVQYSMRQLFMKWLSRNRVMVITSMLVLGALIGGVIATMTIIRQQQLEKIPSLMEAGRAKGKDAEVMLAAGDFKAARDAATAARGSFDSVTRIDEGNAEARQAYEQMSTLIGTVSAKEEQVNKEKADRAAEAERDKKLSQALIEARKLAAIAKDLENKGDSEATRDAKSKARDAFIEAKTIKATNEEAFNGVNELTKWIDDYDTNRERIKSRDRVLQLKAEAVKLFEEAKAAKTYDAAKVKLQAVLTACDTALAEAGGTDPEIVSARNVILITKADAAMDFTRRALDFTPPKFDLADLNLGTAESTGQRTDAIKKLREEYVQKQGLYSTFRKMMDDASKALSDQQYSLAIKATTDALREANTSPFATKQDKETLAKNLQFAQMEDARAREQKETASEGLQRSVNEYQKLLDNKVVTDPDYKTKLEGYLAGARDKLGNALLSESVGVDEAVAREKLGAALLVLTDKAKIVEAKDRLAELTAKAALATVSDRVILLPRGTFIIGSTRDSDGNPQRQVEHAKLVFIDKFLVTNQNYAAFVKAGGYEDDKYWDREAVPLRKTFVDATGKIGPKNWKDGGFDPSVAQLPVTGVCYYEARAYARWQKKRLPTADEWEIAAGAPDVRRSERVGDYSFGTSEDAPAEGVPNLREVGTAEWDRNPLNIRDLGSNCSEWTDTRIQNSPRVVVKGAQPGLKPELFLRFARRAKISSAKLADRNEGRGFRCVSEFKEK
ncbi:MAG: SUMF1/EgtB/PvdO family nonheme iron enzyme [Planctomycetes bacterium]|nr:SUMF1/EgtB/PvdO family nonheme iron enzyme [Planctomycetota bacterium]